MRGWERLAGRRGGLEAGEVFVAVVVVGSFAVVVVVAIGFVVGWGMAVVGCMMAAGFVVGRVVGGGLRCIGDAGVADMFDYVKAAYIGLLVG